MRLAALDIGTNSVRLLVADKTEKGLLPQQRELRATRLGSGLISCGLLSSAGKEATLRAVLELRELALSLGATTIRAVGTSALREAQDGRGFARELKDVTSLDVQILSPEEEATFSYDGAAGTLPLPAGALVFDLGGGSCELSWQEKGVLRLYSLKIGSVYLTESCFHYDPPSGQDIALARKEIKAQLAKLDLGGKPLVGLGGTVTNLAAMVAGMICYDAAKIHGFILSRAAVNKMLAHMLSIPAGERQKIPGIQPSRADILPAGTLVVEELLLSCGAEELTVSEGDMLVGILLYEH